ncbi:MAG: hypothetical protein F4097_01900 [Cenarchaeum sp. SB0672_bin_9]|nr:hypothetical protein [Cenarchaeum sp. SB0672_bin_9]
MSSIQILHYEFLGPIPLREWGPPMEKVVYVKLSRKKDQFHIVYADTCESTMDVSFFVDNDLFSCWMRQSGSENDTYLAILPMFDVSADERRYVLDKILRSTKPPCNKNTI